MSLLRTGSGLASAPGRLPAMQLHVHAADGATINANLNYTPVGGGGLGELILKVQPPAGEVYELHRMIVTVQDGGAWRAEYYGGLGGALSTGIEVRVADGSGTLLDLTAGRTVKDSAGWAHYCYDSTVNTLGAGDVVQVVRWTFAKAGAPIRLVGDRSERLELVFNDNFTGLTGHWFIVQGQKY